jgi:outer membrane lipoprotein-sorting protein
VARDILRSVGKASVQAGIVFLLGALALTAAPQQQKQTPPAAASTDAKSATADLSASEIQDIIQKFAAREKEFKLARDNYTYHQIVKVEELDSEGEPSGVYQMQSDIIFTPQGERIEKVVFAPMSTLRKVSMSPEDEKDIRSIMPFVLTTDDLNKYNIQYEGRQKVDELTTFVFKVGPKVLEKGQRYFEGQIWVDDRDYQIVKTYGKSVPDIRSKKGGNENLFPRFETYRQQIDGKYWFPTWTGADDTLQFSSGPVRIRIIIRYEDYKQFKSKINITYGEEAPQQK